MGKPQIIESVRCIWDGHECTRPADIEYFKTKELPCKVAIDSLIEVIFQVVKINIALNKYEDFNHPTEEEIRKAINASEIFDQVVKEFNIDRNIVLLSLISTINKKFEKSFPSK
jgi:hypothetical protein